VEEITIDRASELLAERRAKGPAAPRRKKAAPRKKAAAKKTTAKKASGSRTRKS
jgi:DNA topoisomerase I